eukprot:2344770-Pyramimonas_sp.AAC.1
MRASTPTAEALDLHPKSGGFGDAHDMHGASDHAPFYLPISPGVRKAKVFCDVSSSTLSLVP